MTKEPTILFVRPGSIRASDKAKLSKVGVVVVEVDDPSEPRLVKAAVVGGVTELSHGDILAAAAEGINNGLFPDEARKAFGKALADAITARHAKKAKAGQPQ